MDVIVHTIRLHSGVDPAQFESWVRDVDYASCPQLPSVVTFSVHRLTTDPAAAMHFVEVIGVRDRKAFAEDMRTEVFRGLVAGFDRLATVVDELAGERIEPGYAAD